MEHVTLYIHENLKKFNVKFLTPSDDQKFPSLKFDVDILDDFKKINFFIKKKKITLRTNYTQIIKRYYEHDIDLYLFK